MRSSGETCTETIVVGSSEMTVATAAKVMRDQHAGAILVMVTESARPTVSPRLITDRNVVVHVVALGLDLKTITVGDMGELLEHGGSSELAGMLDRLRAKGVRHITVMDAEGRPAGLVSIEDMTEPTSPGRTN